MEIVLTVIGVLGFFIGSYFLGNFLIGFEDDTSQDKIMRSFFGVLVMGLIIVLVSLVSVYVNEGVLRLIN